MDFSEAALEKLYSNTEIRPEHLIEVQQAASRIRLHEDRYQAVAESFPDLVTPEEIPLWQVIGIIHCLESNLNFSTHLHNGDPLSHRTTHVPKGRPVADPASGHFPYTWEESARDALRDVWRPKAWTLGGVLDFFEHYNGLGYRSHGIRSPYVWSYTTAYSRGRYTSDGHFDPTAVSKQPGAAAILKVLGVIS